MSDKRIKRPPEQQSPMGPNDFITEAYGLSDKQGLQDFYRKWASEYDAQMQSEGYLSPAGIAKLLDQYLLIDDALVIDIGCGTGMTGNQLDHSRLQALDGLDLSTEMLAVATERNIYRNLYQADLHQSLELQNNIYDAAISSGTFTHGHVDAKPIPEIIRILKSGGLLACTVHFKLWHEQGFDKMFAELTASGLIKCLAVEEGPYFENADNEGWFCVYQKQ